MQLLWGQTGQEEDLQATKAPLTPQDEITLEGRGCGSPQELCALSGSQAPAPVLPLAASLGSQFLSLSHQLVPWDQPPPATAPGPQKGDHNPDPLLPSLQGALEQPGITSNVGRGKVSTALPWHLQKLTHYPHWDEGPGWELGRARRFWVLAKNGRPESSTQSALYPASPTAILALMSTAPFFQV